MKVIINCEDSYSLAVPVELFEKILAESIILKRGWKNSTATLEVVDAMPSNFGMKLTTDAQIEAMRVAQRMEKTA